MISPRRNYGATAAEADPVHDYSSTQFNITGITADTMRKLAASIPEHDFAPDGRESEFHVTIKYGLHFQSPSLRLRRALKAFGPVEITFGRTSVFSNPDADVLKVDVQSDDLHRLNKLISRIVPTHDTHPTYLPHATLAYLKPGKGKKYSGNTALVGQKLRFDSITFSGKKGHRETLPLGHTVSIPYRAA